MTTTPEFITDPDPTRYLSENYVVLDFETGGGRDKGQAVYVENRIVLAVWRLPDGTVKSVRAGEYELQELVEDVKRADFLVCHNAKFELQWLARCGLPLGDTLVWDTMLAEYVIGGNRWSTQHLSLDSIASRRGLGGKINHVSKMIKKGVPVEDIPESWLDTYCRMDVELTHTLFRTQLAEIRDKYPRLLPIVYTRCIVCPVIADIELQGMKLDGELVRTRLSEVEAAYNAAQAELQRFMPGVNPNSPPQMGKFLYDTMGFDEIKKKVGNEWVPDRTETGARKTDAPTLDKLKARTKEQKEFLEVFIHTRALHSELTKYLVKFAQCVEHNDGLLLATIHQTNTATHRFSCGGLEYKTQLHNIPRDYKGMFRAKRDGWLMGESDAKQLEFRTAVHLGRDPVGLKAVVDGKDVHSETASIIGCSRQDAKPHTFKPLYYGRSGTPDEMRYYEHFRKTYASITATQERWIDEVLERKYLETEWGLRYYFPTTRRERSGYVINSTSICNYPVQGFATAEIVPISLVYFWYRTRAAGMQLRVVNSVHDSIISEFPPEEEWQYREIAKVAMTGDVYRYMSSMYGVRILVPLGVSTKVADHWAATKEEEDYEANQGLWRPNNSLFDALE